MLSCSHGGNAFNFFLTLPLAMRLCIFFLFAGCFLFGCQRKVCPSYESAFVHDDSLRLRLFTPFDYPGVAEGESVVGVAVYEEENNELAEEGVLVEIPAVADDSLAISATDTAEEVDMVPSFLGGSSRAFFGDEVMPHEPAPKVRKNRHLVISWYPPVFLKRLRLRTISTNMPKREEEESVEEETPEIVDEEVKEEEEVFWEEEEGLEVEDAVAESEEELVEDDALDEVTPEDLVEKEETPTEEVVEEAGSGYLYGYDPTDNFNIDQVFYNSLFGHLFVPRQIEEGEEVLQEGEVSLEEEEEEIVIPGEYSEEKYYEYLEKESPEGTAEETLLEDDG